MKNPSSKSRAGKPAAINRPVLQFRVHADTYADIKKKAGELKLSISEETARRLDRYAEYEQAFGSAKRIISDADKVIASGKESALRHWGLTPVIGRPGHWIETGKINQEEMIALNPAVETLIERVVLRTLEKARQS